MTLNPETLDDHLEKLGIEKKEDFNEYAEDPKIINFIRRRN